jgi:hypothetical protein
MKGQDKFEFQINSEFLVEVSPAPADRTSGTLSSGNVLPQWTFDYQSLSYKYTEDIRVPMRQHLAPLTSTWELRCPSASGAEAGAQGPSVPQCGRGLIKSSAESPALRAKWASEPGPGKRKEEPPFQG